MKSILTLFLVATLLTTVGERAHAGLLEDLMRRLVGDDTGAPKTSHVSGAPIPHGPDAVTQEYFGKIIKSWCDRTMLDPYNKTDKPDAKVISFIQGTIDVWSHDPDASLPKNLVSQSIELSKAGVDDPLFNVLAGSAETFLDREKELFEKALAGLPASPYSKYFQFVAASNLGKCLYHMHADAATLEKADQVSLGLLRAALETAPFTPGEMSVLRSRLLTHSGEDLFARHAKEMCEILDSSPNVQPWLAEYFEGRRFIDEAWRARGGGWANAVTEQGWKGFEENIASARAHLVKSWELNPKDPVAPTDMIRVTMAENEEKETMRSWFDRAVAAQMDFEPAYEKLIWGLYPRWLGSHEEMLNFGVECMQTGRYDTGVPYEYVRTVRKIAADTGDGGTIFRQPEIYKNLQSVLSSYISVTKFPAKLRLYHTQAALFAFKNDKMDEARQHLQAIQFQPDTSREIATAQEINAMMQKLSPPAQ